MFYLLGSCLALAALLIINVFASITATLVWRALRRPARGWSARTRAIFLFNLRTVPLLGAGVFVAALLIPAYVVNEPERGVEPVSLKLAALALASGLGIALALWRGFRIWRATRRLVNDWMLHAEPVSIAGVRNPAYSFPHPFPVVAVVGASRPRLFIARHLFESLSREELAAVVAHESGHLWMRDNLKHPLMRACGDALLLVPVGRSLNRAWKEEAEVAADEYAAQTEGTAGTLSLASALIKIGRLVPTGTQPTMPAGAFLIEGTEAGIADRVRRLIELAETDAGRALTRRTIFDYAAWAGYASLLALLVSLATQSHTLQLWHTAIERFVSALR
jgi:Zn-dependent protease with chaperone function